MASEAQLEQQIGQLSDWLHERVLTPWKIEELQRELLLHLRQYELNVYRMQIGMPMLHPLYSIGTYIWKQDRGSYQETYGRGSDKDDAWQKSPIKPMYEAGLNERCFRLQDSEAEQFPMLVELRDEGVTEHLVQVAGFSDRSIPTDEQEGVVLTWSTTDADGFTETQIKLLSRLRLPLSALVKGLAQRKLTVDILDTYLGSYSGSRVLSGKIQRGDVEMINAVIFFCDLRDSSVLAKEYSPKAFLDLLNQYYEVTAGTVEKHGGEVLRFIGDASLAIFPIQKFDSDSTACKKALDASKEALRLCDQLNEKRKRLGEQQIKFGIGLHKGEVLYGNMGIPTRLEFTVIGEAANEAARIEGMCKELGETVLVSKIFSECVASNWVSHGRHKLKNIADEIEVLSPVFS
ncbi:MAG: adenylate/guanylate cyclase domain-containing protein [Motiliproteus sp.]